MKKALMMAGLIIVFVVVAIFGYHQVIYQSPEEIFFDGRHDLSWTATEIRGTDLFDEMLPYARPVLFERYMIIDLETVKKWFGVETPEELPSDLEVSPDGSEVLIPTSRMMEKPQITIAFLGPDWALVSSQFADQIINRYPADVLATSYLRVTLLPQSEVEDNWKKELLFDGTFESLANGESKEVIYEPEKSVMAFKRPEVKFFPTPSKIQTAPVTSFREEGKLTLLKNFQANLCYSSATLLGVIFLSEGEPLMAIAGVFSVETDLGTPVFQVFDGKLRLAGFLGSQGQVFPAEHILEGLSEQFPYD